METVLVAVLGVSPSVLTETIWALAQERPAVVPDRVIVLTTTVGRKALDSALFGDDLAWARLCRALAAQGAPVTGKLRFGLATDHVRLFPTVKGGRDLDDISTSEDSATAADFILRTLRAETENPDTRVLASIAGGRKTMGALLMSCMTLLGRKQDRVLHVLVNSPFDMPLDPPFLFPEAKVRYRTRDGALVKQKPHVDLIDIPFVKMRGWYEEAFKRAPPSYAALVNGVQDQAPLPQNYPLLVLNQTEGRMLIDKRIDVTLSAAEFGVVSLLLGGMYSHKMILEGLCAFKTRNLPPHAPVWLHDLKESSRFKDDEATEDVAKTCSSARTKLRRIPALQPLVNIVLPLRGRKPSYPASKICFTGQDPFADIRGHLISPQT